MLEILIIEDNESKRCAVEAAIARFIDTSTGRVTTATNLSSSRELLSATKFDLVILDLRIPMRPGEQPRDDAGMLLLDELEKSNHGLMVPSHIVGLSEHENLVASHGTTFTHRMWHLIFYDSSSEEWIARLGQKLVHIVESAFSSEVRGFDYDAAVVTALEAVELEAVLRLPGSWQEKRFRGDSTIYHLGQFGPGRRKVRVVAATAIEPGMPSATALSMKVIERFRPKVLCMSGIAAGVAGAFGDILVADQCWDYGSGKRLCDAPERSRFSPSPTPIPIHPTLRAKMSKLGMDGTLRERIRSSWSGKAPEAPPSIRLGPIASGASVIADRRVVDEILDHNRKLVGIEMEAYGVFLAAAVCCDPKPMPLVAKSICDFADPAKGDAYQAYAAHTSARFIYEYFLTELKADGGRPSTTKRRKAAARRPHS